MKRSLGLFLVNSFIWLVCACAVSAQEMVVETDFPDASRNVLQDLRLVEDPRSEVSILLPARTQGPQRTMTLKASTPQEINRWLVLTLRNPTEAVQNLVLVFAQQGFAGSGLMSPVNPGSKIRTIAVSRGNLPDRLVKRTTDAFMLRLLPDQSVTYALEVDTVSFRHVRLWHAEPFFEHSDRAAFLHGGLLGVALFIGLTALILIIIGRGALQPVTAIFVWTFIAFIAQDLGYLSSLERLLAVFSSQPVIGALVELALLLSIVVMAGVVTAVHKKSVVGPIMFGLAIALLAGIFVYAFIDARQASGFVRLIWFPFVLLSAVWIYAAARRDRGSAKFFRLPWAALALWSTIAAVTALLQFDPVILQLINVYTGLLVLMVFCFAMVQTAFANAPERRLFFQQADLRAMALTGTGQALWERNTLSGELTIGVELLKALGRPEDMLAQNAQESFTALIHPGDRLIYEAAVEYNARRAEPSLRAEFRLQREDGAYRWFTLKARRIVNKATSSERQIGTLSDTTAERLAQDRLLEDSVRDTVTGLPNKALFLDRVSVVVKRIANASQKVRPHIIIIDLDGLQQLRDDYGSDLTDLLMRTVADRLAKFMRPSETLARLPGSRFGLFLLQVKTSEEMILSLEHLRTELAHPVVHGEGEVSLTACFGISRYRKGTSADELYDNAEIAVNEARRRGGDIIEFYHPRLRLAEPVKGRLDQQLILALRRGEFDVVYQPIMRLETGELSGFEALVRWRHPRRGMLLPEDFIGIAEETGLIRDIGTFVLREAARQLGIWRRTFKQETPIFVAVNVSSAQLLTLRLVKEVGECLEREGLDPSELKLEITETLVKQNPAMAREVLHRLSDLGISISCDDFGTGYSGLENLHRLPFDVLKIDKYFIEHAQEDEAAAIILESTIAMAHRLGLEVVAEGVETEPQLDYLSDLDCDFGQGYFIGQPVDAQTVVEAFGETTYMLNNAGGNRAVWKKLFGGRDTDAEEAQEEYAHDQPAGFDALEDAVSLEDPDNLEERDGLDEPIDHGHRLSEPARRAQRQPVREVYETQEEEDDFAADLRDHFNGADRRGSPPAHLPLADVEPPPYEPAQQDMVLQWPVSESADPIAFGSSHEDVMAEVSHWPEADVIAQRPRSRSHKQGPKGGKTR